jgi:hypothetical protein
MEGYIVVDVLKTLEMGDGVVNSRETRTTSDLYLLEDIVSHVKFICDLSMALRLNVSQCFIFHA